MRKVIPLAIPNLCGNEEQYLRECISSSFVSSVGPFVTRFEEMVAKATGARYSVATSSGTSGLHLALAALGVGPDDLVILPSFTFIASANAIAQCGADPWLLDIESKSWTLDAGLLDEVLASQTYRRNGELFHAKTSKRVAAIMPVYTLGTTAEIDAINEIAQHYRLPVVADAAAAIGAQYKGRPLAGLADLTVLSFNGNKTITAGGGGMVVGNDEKLLALARHLSTQARVGQDYHHDRKGFNYRLTNLQAAVGCAQMELLAEFLKAKRSIRKKYDLAFADVPGIGLFPQVDWCDSTCWFSGITIQAPDLPSVAKICELLQAEGIQTRPFWKPIHLQPPYAKSPLSSVSVSEKLWAKILTLPCSTGLTSQQQDYIIAQVKKILIP